MRCPGNINGRQIFGVDGVAYQRSIRDEWELGIGNKALVTDDAGMLNCSWGGLTALQA